MFQSNHYQITSSRLPPAFDGCRIAHLSDLHGESHGTENQDLLRAIIQFQPDFTVLTGDMVGADSSSIPLLLSLCKRLRDLAPVYFIEGNHEQTMDKEERNFLLNSLSDCGLTILSNDTLCLSRNGEEICIHGLVMPMIYYNDPLGESRKRTYFSPYDVSQALGPCDLSRYHILLAHNPIFFPSYRDWGADLTLSGHIHGGIIRIPGLGGLLSPDVRLFPKYDAGHFLEQDRHLIVSRGLGNQFLIRVFNPPDLVLITLNRT